MTEQETTPPAVIARHIAAHLDEHAPAGRSQIIRVVRVLGAERAYDLAARALFIQATGGLPLPAPWNRNRTPGGVFFLLARNELDDEQYQRVYRRPRRRQVEPIPAPPAPPRTAPRKKIPPAGVLCAGCQQVTAPIARFHFGPAGKVALCAACEARGYAFAPDGTVKREMVPA